MHIELLVEEPSAEAALTVLLPRLLGNHVTYQIHPHQGKCALLKVLPEKLRAYAKWLPDDWHVVVLIDEDRADCHKLRVALEQTARRAKLKTKTAVRGQQRFQLLNRIAIEELEAWFFGDIPALCTAFPRVPQTLGARMPFRDPDQIKGGTWERLQRVLQNAGYYRTGLAKIAAAREIARHMDPARNQSRSFQVFRDGLRSLVG